MLIDVALRGGINLADPNLQIGAAGIYNFYTNQHLDRDWEVRRYLTRKQRLVFARAAALLMLESGGRLATTIEAVYQIIERGLVQFSEEEESDVFVDGDKDRISTDVRLCSFITVSDSGGIEFVHKSFMEYFIADVIVEEIKGRKPIDTLGLNLNYEVLYFLGSFCLLRKDFRVDLIQHARDIAPSQGVRYKSNCLIAIMFSGEETASYNFDGLNFTKLILRKKIFSSCNFSSCNLKEVIFHTVVFAGCTFNDFSLDGDLTSCSLKSSIGSVHLPMETKSIDVDSCRGLNLKSPDSGVLLFSNCVVSGSDVEIHGKHITLNKGRVSASNMKFEKGCRIVFEETELSGTSITSDYTDSKGKVLFLLNRSSVFRDVFFNFCCMKSTALDHGLNSFDKCSGAILVDESEKEFKKFYKQVSDAGGKSMVLKRVNFHLHDGLLFVPLESLPTVVSKLGKLNRFTSNADAIASLIDHLEADK